MAKREDHFDWNPQEQGLILGAFYYGYIWTQVPGGILAERYGGKWVFGLGTFVTGFLTLFTPMATRRGLASLFVLRLFEGFFEVRVFRDLNLWL